MSYCTNHRLLRLKKIFKRSFRNPSGSRTNVPEGNSNRGDTLPGRGFLPSYVVAAWMSSAPLLRVQWSCKAILMKRAHA